jgi:hypothetical protein
MCQEFTHHRWVKWMIRLSTIGPDRLMEMSDHPMRELLVRSTASVSYPVSCKNRALGRKEEGKGSARRKTQH